MNILKRAALSVVPNAEARRPDRQALRDANARRDAAENALIAQRELVARLSIVVEASDAATRIAAKAKDDAAQARKAWLRDGCPAHARTRYDLQGAADGAARDAELARADAADAAKELPKASSELRTREGTLGYCEEAIGAAIKAIICAERRNHLETLKRRFDADLLELRREFNFGAWLRSDEGGANRSAGDSVYDFLVQSCAEAFRLEIKDVDRVAKPHLETYAGPWRERAAQLRLDPDA
jgi:hypothetical protein